MNCKHFDFDNFGNSICKLGGTCENPNTCRSRVAVENTCEKR